MEKTKQATDEFKTEAMKKQVTDGISQLQVATEEEDPFRRLPKEVMHNIISRLADLKSLCRYSLVSKHFAKAISGVRTVSVKLSGSVTYDQERTEFLSSFLRLGHTGSGEKIRGFLKKIDFSGKFECIQNLNLPTFLQKLTELESVNLEYDYPQSDDGYPFPMWKMNFVGGNSLKIEGFVALVPAGPDSIRKDSCDRKFLYGKDFMFEMANAVQMNSFWLRYYGRYCEWLCLALMLAKFHASLRSVTINDPGLHAKLPLEGELLAKIANTGYAADFFSDLVGHNVVRVARMPILHFPLSGYVMRWPALVMIHDPDVDLCSSAKKLDQVMFGNSGDEFEQLREAVTEVFENHAHEILLWGSISNRAI